MGAECNGRPETTNSPANRGGFCAQLDLRLVVCAKWPVHRLLSASGAACSCSAACPCDRRATSRTRTPCASPSPCRALPRAGIVRAVLPPARARPWTIDEQVLLRAGQLGLPRHEDRADGLRRHRRAPAAAAVAAGEPLLRGAGRQPLHAQLLLRRAHGGICRRSAQAGAAAREAGRTGRAGSSSSGGGGGGGGPLRVLNRMRRWPGEGEGRRRELGHGRAEEALKRSRSREPGRWPRDGADSAALRSEVTMGVL